jgi:hypothetical protein
LQRARERSIQHLLRHLALAPGESVRGELWLPARPVGRAMGSEPSGRVSSFHDITLRTPDALGGQEIEYSVVPER